MVDAGCIDTRGHASRPSMRRLAEKAGTTTTTISKLVFGERETEPEIVAAVAAVLRVTPETIAAWRNRQVVGTPYAPPAEARLLSGRQRRALTELIRAFVDEGGGSRGDTAPMNTQDVTAVASEPGGPPAGAPSGRGGADSGRSGSIADPSRAHRGPSRGRARGSGGTTSAGTSP